MDAFSAATLQPDNQSWLFQAACVFHTQIPILQDPSRSPHTQTELKSNKRWPERCLFSFKELACGDSKHRADKWAPRALGTVTAGSQCSLHLWHSFQGRKVSFSIRNKLLAMSWHCCPFLSLQKHYGNGIISKI